MKRERFTEEQIVGVLWELEAENGKLKRVWWRRICTTRLSGTCCQTTGEAHGTL